MIFPQCKTSNSSTCPEGDTLCLYDELLGDYEFYDRERYISADVYLSDSILMMKIENQDPVELILISLDSLFFHFVEREKDTFHVVFSRNDEGMVNCLSLSDSTNQHIARRKSVESQTTFTSEQLQDDFKQLRKHLEDNHPKLYRFASKQVLDSMFDYHYKMIDRPMTTQEFYSIITPLIAMVGCAHTSIWSPQGYWDNAPDKMFPLKLYISQDDRAWMIHQYGAGSQIPPGSEITAINGMPFNQIINKLLLHISSDGYNHSLRIWKLNGNFLYLHALIFGFHDDFDIEFQYYVNRDVVTLSAVSRDTIFSFNKQEWDETWFDHDLKFSIHEDSKTAIMKIKTFAYYGETKKFKSFLDDSFNKIRKNNINNLILDLRDNDGGDPFCSTPLLAYLEPEPIPYFRERYGRYAQLADPIPRAENPYEGNLYILINGGGYSTTGHFTSVLKYHNIGTFIGLETGGTYTCNDASKMINLKNTRYYINCPRGSFATAVSGMADDRGIIPDIMVEPSAEDLINGRDPILEVAFDLIKNGK
ncbi:MAG: hypothetical protein AMS27_14965 [Bacteroides sp. SM23_62_1]|nr:MAG: hypothetical protein AMS27_14965 [Bacteroides sp. SM23_62_1]